MPLQFREDRATQAAAHFLRLHKGHMSYMKLLKLMYLADRLSLLTLGHPITYDRPVSMKFGPVLSHVYDLLRDRELIGQGEYWREHISPPKLWWVTLRKETSNDQLSPAEESILGDIWALYGHLNQWALSDVTHKLPEWSDPNGSSKPIAIRDILQGANMSKEEAEELLADLHAHTSL